MISYIAKRIASIIPSLFAVLTALFFVLRVVPGGPFDADRKLPPEVERSLRDYYDLSAPVYIQYKNWLVKLIVHQDLGPTFRYGGRSVNEIIRLSLPYSAQLGFFAALLALGIGIPLGVYAATKHNTVKDHAAMAVAMTGVSIPRFVLAPLLIRIFSLKLYSFPVARWETWRHMVLPVICAALPLPAYLTRAMLRPAKF